AFELLLLAAQNAVGGPAVPGARALAEAGLETTATPGERAPPLESLGAAFRNAALGDEAWIAYSQAVDALREGGSTDHERIGRLSGLALETVVRWSGTMRSLPPEERARGYLTLAVEALPLGDSEARVRLMTAQAFWGHGYPDTDAREGDPVHAERTGTAAAEGAMRLGRPDLAVVALDSVQHNLQRRLPHQRAVEASRRRLRA